MKAKRKADPSRDLKLKEAVKVKRKTADSGEESTVTKAVKNVKQIFEKKNLEKKSVERKVEKVVASAGKKEQKETGERGIVYVGHIPHGFYEDQMKQYFAQFGKVTRVRVARSKKTGNSRGYGYVEFLHSEVAKIAAETMNNYLMCGRLLKATYVPPEKQHEGFFLGKSWTKQKYPRLVNRRRVVKVKNGLISKHNHAKSTNRTKQKLSNLQKKLKEKGIHLEFKPVVT